MQVIKNEPKYLAIQWTADLDPATFPPFKDKEFFTVISKDDNGTLLWTGLDENDINAAPAGTWFIGWSYWLDTDYNADWANIEMQEYVTPELFAAKYTVQ